MSSPSFEVECRPEWDVLCILAAGHANRAMWSDISVKSQFVQKKSHFVSNIYVNKIVDEGNLLWSQEESHISLLLLCYPQNCLYPEQLVPASGEG